ncbi:DUF2852 domain-containing protein [Ruegeria sediminis]|uniref:DUF2852 domain-containing protein n=1 Tax=Ruegeria sediminis TaxID=2583820 RepID=A0ABY2WW15_9RHOB|nr:DUF2852 domain-containing protein [Ruegeria sediminis]TMV06466.1 DUF2852 domain-containing protein [Ruegeria sediminis]
MTTLSEPAAPSHSGWFHRAEAWLDSKGKGAWIAVMVLGFVFFWPIGLALLAYLIWSKRMFGKSCSRRKTWHSHMSAMTPTGNSAFDAYKADTLARLEREQHDFEAFLERLREAKDKAEFDQFMEERARANREEAQDKENGDA